MPVITQPVPFFADLDGSPLDNGRVYFGTAGGNPVTSPVTVYWDEAETQPVAQPAQTMNGMIYRSGTPAAVYASVPLSVLVQNSAGAQVLYAASVPTIDSTLRADLAASSGSSLVGFIQPSVGATARTLQSRERDTVHAFDFMTPAQIADVVAGTMTLDVSTPLQAAIAACESDNQWSGRTLFLPAGRYRINTALVLNKQFIRIVGEGCYASVIVPTGAGVKGITVAAINYLRPFFSDFGVRSFGATNTGNVIDFDAILLEVYLGELRNLYLEGGGVCLAARRYFSMNNHNIAAASYNDHAFRVSCGPGVSWTSCYALQTGAGKAGYRMIGIVNMLGCNGVNLGDWWAIFGQDPTATDGYQNDFPGAGNSFPDCTLVGCNAEEYASISANGGGIMLHNIYRHFNFIGGKFDRFNLATPYQAVVYARFGSNSPEQPIRLSPGSVFLGAGVPALAHLYADTGANFWDENSAFIVAGATTYKVGANVFPLLSDGATSDVFRDVAFTSNAIYPRRITTAVQRYVTATPTVVGANQIVDVTANTRIKISPAAAASVSRFTFDQTIGAGSDYLRNGALIVEAGNGNLTLNHNAAGEGGMRMRGAANITMAQGDIRVFQWSDNYTAGVAGWIEV